MESKETYAFRLNANPTTKELDAALSAIYALTVDGAKLYKYQCPINYEELGSYVFNRILKILDADCVKANIDPSWQNGLRLWMAETTWKTAPAYVRSMLSSGFIDYTRSFYSEFKHIPTDTQKSMFMFDKAVTYEDKVSVHDIKEAFARLSTDIRKQLYATYAMDAMCFSTEFRTWFESVSNPKVITIEDLYDLSHSQIEQIRNGVLAYKIDEVVWYNVAVEKGDKEIVLYTF